MTIPIVVVDDHAMFLESLVRTLSDEPEIEVVGTAHDVAGALAVLARTAPRVVVLDQQLPDGNGVDLALRLRAERPELALLMLTGVTDGDLLQRAVAAGYAGFVTKDRAVHELVDAVRAASVGETHISVLDLGALLERVADGSPVASSRVELSARELEAMRLAAQGLPNRAIAEAMYLSSHTIKNYMQSAIGKLGAHSKLEAVTIAIREGIVTVDRDR